MSTAAFLGRSALNSITSLPAELPRSLDRHLSTPRVLPFPTTPPIAAPRSLSYAMFRFVFVAGWVLFLGVFVSLVVL